MTVNAQSREELSPGLPGLETSIEKARNALLAEQRPDGHWCYELEADCTIPAEYVIFLRYLGEEKPDLEQRIGRYLRANQADGGGWLLYPGGPFDLSCSVKAYFALKLIGDDPQAQHMLRARRAILAAGGAARSNVFTRITLAIFGQVPWRAVPFMPPEIVLLPRWFPFHMSKVSYWSRTVMVPLFILHAHRARARNPEGIGIPELFTVEPEEERRYFPVRSPLNRLFLVAERTVGRFEPLIPAAVRRLAVEKAEAWIIDRLNGRDGLGGIFPAMVNAYMALELLGHDREEPHMRVARQAIDALLVDRGDTTYCQPCVSPVWDTGLAAHALLEESREANPSELRRTLDWLVERQILDQPGDWKEKSPGANGGGWAFQYSNPWYPDLDDTALVAWALHEASFDPEYRRRANLAADWLCSLQSRQGGFASFDPDNTAYFLNEIPFADHGALLDPPTADVTARCIALLRRLERPQDRKAIERATLWLLEQQEENGSWFGRWGTNYIYGTWSALAALEGCQEKEGCEAIERAADWLESVQHEDGGWGESNDTYEDPHRGCADDPSTAFQTAWALLGLLAAGRTGSPAVARGVRWLLEHQEDDGLWSDPEFTAPGFPRVFYLKYHGYSRYFPLWALARYRNLTARTGPHDVTRP